MEIIQGTVDHQEIDEMEVSPADNKQNLSLIENDLTKTKSTEFNLNENSNKENVNNDVEDKSDESDQHIVDIASHRKSEPQPTSILNSATFPSMFSSSFSSLKSFAKRSLSS